jgi:hypothetical protein
MDALTSASLSHPEEAPLVAPGFGSALLRSALNRSTTNHKYALRPNPNPGLSLSKPDIRGLCLFRPTERSRSHRFPFGFTVIQFVFAIANCSADNFAPVKFAPHKFVPRKFAFNK